jgi:NAD(P)-dependent dehydrogenase (short-subunit alcohol dehydrogenase family)
MSKGKVLFVTGGSRGIGADTCLLGAKAGYRVAFSYASNAAAAEKVVTAIKAEGGEALAVKGDVGSETDVLAMFEAVDEAYGQLDAFVNNAGIVDQKTRVDQLTLARLERMMRINVIGSFLCAREAVKRMSNAHGGKGGAIVNLSSVEAALGAAGQYVDYAASKGAVETMTVGLALEVANEGVRVNCVRPGIIDTEIHASGGQPDRAREMRNFIPMKREGRPDEIARSILWLLSDDASYITGTILSVSGGR